MRKEKKKLKKKKKIIEHWLKKFSVKTKQKQKKKKVKKKKKSTKNENLEGNVENIFLLYSTYLQQFKEQVVLLNQSVPQSLLNDCSTLLATINTANSNLEEYKKLAKDTQKALNKLMDGDF